MANPTLSGSLDKANYAPGEQVTLTLSVVDPDRASFVVTGTYTDSAGGRADFVANATIDQGTFTVTSAPAKVWTKVSESGGTAVFTTTA